MNDEFLYRLRAQPPANFAANLRARLEMQAAMSAAKRRAATWCACLGILLGTVAVAVVTPTIRTAVVSWLGITSESDTTPSLRRTADGAPRQTVGVGSGARLVDAERVASAESRMAEATNADLSRELRSDQAPSSNAPIASSASSAPRQLRRVVAVAGPEALQEVLGMVIESFEETYGYSVERKLVSADDALCSRFTYNYPDVIVTLGRMSDAERTLCGQRGTRLMEVPIAYEAYVAVVHRENTWVNSLTIEDLNALGGRWPHDTLATWNQLRPSWPSLPITLIGIDSTNRSFSEPFVPSRIGRGIPIRVQKNDAGISKAVDATYGGLGFMSYATYRSQSAAASKVFSAVPVRVVGIVNQKGDVVMPSPETIQDERYDTLSRPLVFHFNLNQLFREEVLLFGTHAVEGTSQRLSEHGLMPIDERAVDAAARKLRAASAGR